MYLTILWAASMCELFGCCKYWLRLCTLKSISVRYSSFSINLWYDPWSNNTSSSVSEAVERCSSYYLVVSFILLSIGVPNSFAVVSPSPCMSYNAYFSLFLYLILQILFLQSISILPSHLKCLLECILVIFYEIQAIICYQHVININKDNYRTFIYFIE